MSYRLARPSMYLALALSMLAGDVQAEPEVLNVAIPPEGYPPYIITNSTPGVGALDDSPTGIVIEVLKDAAAKEHISLAFLEAPELRSQKMLNEDMIDVRMESPLWVDNPEAYFWSESITHINDVFVYSRRSPVSFEHDEDLIGAEIVTHLGYKYPTLEPLFDSGQATRDDRQTEEYMLTAIYQERNREHVTAKRAVVMDELVARWFISRYPRYEGQFLFSRRLVASAPVHFQFARNPENLQLMERLNRHIVDMKESGRLADLIIEMINLPEAEKTSAR